VEIRLNIAVILSAEAVVKKVPEKSSGLNKIPTLDLCHTGAAFYQLS